MMTRQEQEQELLYIIRSHDDPALALQIAMQVIISVLEQPESCQEPCHVGVQALA